MLGHVDAGKSTLMGRLLHATGAVSQRQAHKNEKESAAAGKGSFSWAWALDERPEERERGVTVAGPRGNSFSCHDHIIHRISVPCFL